MKRKIFLAQTLENTNDSWNLHWNSLHKSGFLNKIFVFVRYNIIANHVAGSLDKYFPKTGIFLDSGCGTSQTSVKIQKLQRKLIAMDISDIIFSTQPKIVDYKVNGNVFSLPFKDGSLDGLWNVGLMEHFQPEELDLVFKEFHRVLKKGNNAVLFWPAAYSSVNIMVKIMSFLNRKLNKNKSSMFPVESSLIRSKKWVKRIVERNGFSLAKFEWPLRGGLIHHTVVIKKL